jgi:hypothetical protein
MTGRGHSRRDVSSWAGGNSESSHGNHVPRYAFDSPTWIKTKEKRLTLRYGFHNSSESMWWTLASERSRADGLYANSPMSKFHPLSIWAMLALETWKFYNISIVFNLQLQLLFSTVKSLPAVQIVCGIITEEDGHRFRVAASQIGRSCIAPHKIHSIAHSQFWVSLQNFGFVSGMLSDQTRPDVFIIDLFKPVVEFVSTSFSRKPIRGLEILYVLITDLQVSCMAENIFHSSHGVIHELQNK